MAFHFSNMGGYSPSTRDQDGYVPEANDTDPWDFTIDHGGQRTHNEDGTLTEYGEWWEEEGFPEWRDKAVAETAKCSAALARSQEPLCAHDWHHYGATGTEYGTVEDWYCQTCGARRE